MLKLTVIGHLGQNAKVNKVEDRLVINFSVAHTERIKINEAYQERTQWIACSYWTDKTKVAEYLTQGRLILVEGVPSINSYANKEGVKLTSLNLRVEHIELLGKNNGTNDTAATPNTEAAPIINNGTGDEDLPF